MSKSKRINTFYKELYKRYGPQSWWPGDSALECILGAVLTQNTSWTNAEKAISNLKKGNIINIDKLASVRTEELASLIRPSGYYNQKALKIKHFISFVVENYDGDLERMFEEQTNKLRNMLLTIKGIGPETADTILLYAAQKPVFVIDAYTYRVLSRHGLVPEQTSYDEMQELFMDTLSEDTKVFNEYHALLVRVGKEHCKKRSPKCEGCPLQYDPHTIL